MDFWLCEKLMSVYEFWSFFLFVPLTQPIVRNDQIHTLAIKWIAGAARSCQVNIISNILHPLQFPTLPFFSVAGKNDIFYRVFA